jgi:trehalose 6-phosphate phosphatase
LFLDVDGTLLDFEARPDAVRADAQLRTLLERASRAVGGALALVSGRSLAQLDALFAPRHWPAAGLHGLERRDAEGGVHPGHAGPLPATVLDALQRIAARHPGLLVEDKGRAAALHYRAAPALGAELEQAVTGLALAHDGLAVQPGACVVEIRPGGASKAHAIHAFMAEPPFHGRLPLYAGDDLTDLPAFAAVQSLGGVSVAVGSRVSAMCRLDTPADVRRELAAFIRGGAGR